MFTKIQLFIGKGKTNTRKNAPSHRKRQKPSQNTTFANSTFQHPTLSHSLFHFRHGPPCTVSSRKFLIIHLEVSIIMFTFVPVMLGQASAIKARNQVFEYPPLSKLAGCFLYQGTGCKDTTISSFHQLFLLLSFVLYIRHHLYSTSTTSLYSTSSTSLIPFPPPPSFHSP